LTRVLIVPLTRPYVVDYLDVWSSSVRDSLYSAGLGLDILVWPSVLKPPMDCFVWRRVQYLSSCLLRWLYSCLSRDFVEDYVVGVGYLDAFERGLNFVFGEASPSLRTAIVCTRRLDPRFYGGRPDFNLYVERVSKEIVHELGHLLGLEHCVNRECVMSFSNSVYDVDVKTRFFCKNCIKKLKRE